MGKYIKWGTVAVREVENILKAFPFWGDLSEAEKEDIKKYATIRIFEEGNVIFAKDSECLGLICLIEGSIRTYMVSESGREITLYRMQPKEVDLLSASCVMQQITFHTQMVAEEKTKILIVPAICIARLKEKNLAVRCYVYEYLSKRFSDVMKTMENILFTRIDKRLADFLLEKSRNQKSREITVTHEELAQNINSAREVVARVLKGFEKRGLVKLGRKKIELLDINALKRYV